MLFQSKYITKFLAGLMLLVFALSITPKKYLHSVFAKHIDNNTLKNYDKPCQLNKAGYNCDIDNLVAESVFTGEQYSFEFPAFLPFSSYILKNISSLSSTEIFSKLRGPPVNI